jgi:hypothetical protein
VPFQDTLPRAYEYDIFRDYVRPYFKANPLTRFSVNDHFTFHGVQFKVMMGCHDCLFDFLGCVL